MIDLDDKALAEAFQSLGLVRELYMDRDAGRDLIRAYLSALVPADVADVVQRLNGEAPDKMTATDQLRLFAHDPETFAFDQDDALTLIPTIEEAASLITSQAADNARMVERIAELERERDKLVLSTGDHITRRSDLLARAERAEADLAKAREALEALDAATVSAIHENNNPNRVIFKDGFVLEGRAADEWLKFMRLIQTVARRAQGGTE